MTECWIRVRGGALTAKIEDWSVVQPLSWERNGPGECWISVPLTDPSIQYLRHPEAMNGRVWRTWYESNIELAFWRDPIEIWEPFDVPDQPPDWAGPIVGGRRAPGVREVHALTQEAYVQRSCIGDELTNYLITDGASDYLFEDDPDLDEWTIDLVGPGPSGSATTSTTGAQYLPGGVAILNDAVMYAHGEVPTSDDGNYAFVGVAVYVPDGVTPLFPTDDGGAVVGDVDIQTSDNGILWGDDPFDSHRLMLPAGYQTNRWYPLLIQMGQPPDEFVRYKLSLYGGDGGDMRFSRPKVYRPANVGAAADADIGAVAAAIAQDLVNNLIGPFDRDSDEVGVNLVEAARYFFTDHLEASDGLNDWSDFLDWWVIECTIFTGQRGEEIDDELTGEDLSGWVVEDDAADSYNTLYVQVRPEDGPPDQITLKVDDPATRLTHVVQIPAEMGPADAARYGESVLADGEPAVTLTAVPVKYAVLPGERLYDFMPGNWLAVQITEISAIGPITETFEPVVERVTWDPVTDEVRPKWVLGRKSKRNETEILGAMLKQLERERRMYRAPALRPDLRGHTPDTVTWTDGDLRTIDVPVGEGLYTATAYSSVVGGAFTAGSLQVTVSGTITGGSDDIRSLIGQTDIAGQASMTFKGPQTITAGALCVDEAGGSGITSQTLRVVVQRFA